MLRVSNIQISVTVVNTNPEVDEDCRLAKSMGFDELPHSDGEEYDLISEAYHPNHCSHHFTWRLKPDS